MTDTYHETLDVALKDRFTVACYRIVQSETDHTKHEEMMISSGTPNSYAEFYELFGWFAIEDCFIDRVDRGWPRDGMSYAKFLRWTMTKQDNDENNYNHRHYLQNNIIAVGYANSSNVKAHDIIIRLVYKAEDAVLLLKLLKESEERK